MLGPQPARYLYFLFSSLYLYYILPSRPCVLVSRLGLGLGLGLGLASSHSLLPLAPLSTLCTLWIFWTLSHSHSSTPRHPSVFFRTFSAPSAHRGIPLLSSAPSPHPPYTEASLCFLPHLLRTLRTPRYPSAFFRTLSAPLGGGVVNIRLFIFLYFNLIN